MRDGTYNLPIDWTALTGTVSGSNSEKGGIYPLRGILDLSGTSNVENPNAVMATGTLTVSAIEFSLTGKNTKTNIPNSIHSTFGDAYTLPVPGVTAAGADSEHLKHLLATSGTLNINGAPVNYIVNWDNNTTMNLTRPNEHEFHGTISFPNPEPWFTLPAGGEMRVSRTIEVRNVLPIWISYWANGKTYDGQPWDIGTAPQVMLNGKPVDDQPDSFNWWFAGGSHEPRTAPPVNAGLYTATISVEAYGNYTRATITSNAFNISQRGVTLRAVSDTVPQGKYVDGGLPSINYEVDGIAAGDNYRDVMTLDPPMRIKQFDGSVLGVYVLEFTASGTQNPSPLNYSINDWIDGTITVVTPDAPTFRVSVSGGTVAGGGSFAEYAAGTTVTVTANDNPSGRTFTRWSSSPSVTFANATSRTTTFVMPAGEVVVTATFDRIPVVVTPTIPKEPIFPDLTSGPAFNAVQWAATMKIIEGRDGLFHPKVEMTRSQIVVILHRYAERPNVSATVSFTDVTPGTTIGRAVAWAVSNDITTGRSSTVFDVNDIISREALMVMLYRYHTRVLDKSGAASANALARFTDSGDVSSTALNAIRWAVENGLLTGQGGKILPKASMTRDQLVTILYRYDKAFN